MTRKTDTRQNAMTTNFGTTPRRGHVINSESHTAAEIALHAQLAARLNAKPRGSGMPHAQRFRAPDQEAFDRHAMMRRIALAAQPYQTGPRVGAWLAEQRRCDERMRAVTLEIASAGVVNRVAQSGVLEAK